MASGNSHSPLPATPDSMLPGCELAWRQIGQLVVPEDVAGLFGSVYFPGVREDQYPLCQKEGVSLGGRVIKYIDFLLESFLLSFKIFTASTLAGKVSFIKKLLSIIAEKRISVDQEFLIFVKTKRIIPLFLWPY